MTVFSNLSRLALLQKGLNIPCNVRNVFELVFLSYNICRNPLLLNSDQMLKMRRRYQKGFSNSWNRRQRQGTIKWKSAKIQTTNCKTQHTRLKNKQHTYNHLLCPIDLFVWLFFYMVSCRYLPFEFWIPIYCHYITIQLLIHKFQHLTAHV